MKTILSVLIVLASTSAFAVGLKANCNISEGQIVTFEISGDHSALTAKEGPFSKPNKLNRVAREKHLRDFVYFASFENSKYELTVFESKSSYAGNDIFAGHLTTKDTGNIQAISCQGKFNYRD